MYLVNGFWSAGNGAMQVCRLGGRRRGFTLIEVLVVISLIGMLMAMLIPAVLSVRESARQVACANNLAQLGMALHGYDAANGGLPAGCIEAKGPIHNVARGHHMGWIVALLPHLDEGIMYRHVDQRASVYDKKNAPVRAVVVRNLFCPSSGGVRTRQPGRTDDGEFPDGIALTTYAGCHNDVESPIDTLNHGVLFLNSHITQRDVTDGVTHTIYVGERIPDEQTDLGWLSGTSATLRNASEWLMGEEASKKSYEIWADEAASQPKNELRVGGFGSYHTSGSNFLFGDGAVHLLVSDVELSVLQQMAHRADGKLLTQGPTRGR